MSYPLELRERFVERLMSVMRTEAEAHHRALGLKTIEHGICRLVALDTIDALLGWYAAVLVQLHKLPDAELVEVLSTFREAAPEVLEGLHDAVRERAEAQERSP